MKRTLLGLFVMGSLVGIGSVGVYYAQGKLAPRAGAAETVSDDTVDRTPKPIPLAKSQASAPAASPFMNDSQSVDVPASNPYGEPAQEVAASGHVPDSYDSATDSSYADTSYTEPNYADTSYADDYSQDIPAADPLPAADESLPAEDRYAEYDAQPAAAIAAVDGDIPDASQMAAAPGAGPFAGQSQPVQQTAATQYAQQTAPADAYAQVDGEPRRLQGAAPQAAAGNYDQQSPGNPLRKAASGGYEQPADDYANDALPADSTGRYGADEPVAAPLAAGSTSFDTPHGAEGTGRPGDPSLNGPQAPALTIEKGAPPEIQIGKPAKFAVKVKNVGTATAHDVEVHDMIPQGTQLLDTAPPSNRGTNGDLVWELGALKPGDERMVEMQVMPVAEGEVGSVASVHFHAQASARTVATKPMLTIEVLGPSKVMKGEALSLRVKLSNPGSGAAAGVMLSETVPHGLSHAAGKELEFEVGTLKPGETRELDLALMASEAGLVTNVITAEAEAQLHAEARTEIEVVAPLLQVSMSGPKRRYLERNATHNISVTNPGTAAAKNIDLVAVLPRTLKFVEANNGGQFDEATHAVYWNLEELPPQETGTVRLTTLPLEAGEARVVIKTSSQSGLKDEREEVVAIEGLAALNFQLSDTKDPIEVGGETSYEIRITNQGTKAATNVLLAALLPRGMKPLTAEGPVRYKIEGQRVIFEPLKTLAAKADTAFTLKVQAVEVGDQRIEVQVATDEIRDPISKEESTRVYGDE